MKKRAVEVLPDVGLVVGAATVVFGLWEIYRPLGPIAGGLVLAVGCWFLSYARPRGGEKH